MLKENLDRIRQYAGDPMNSGPALALSRQLFGNNAGMKQNVYGNLELWNSRRNGPFAEQVGTHPAVQAIDQVGYVKAPWSYPAELIDRMQERFAQNIATDNVVTQRNRDGGLLNIAARDVLHSMPEVREFLNDELRSVLRSYFGSFVRVYKPDFWRNFHIPEADLVERERYSERWHNDSGKTSILSILILMSDVSEENGPTWCISRPTTRALMKHEYKSRDLTPLDNIAEGRAEVVKFVGRRGDAWLLNTRRTLHRAGIPAPGKQRDLLGLKFTPAAGDSDVWDEIPRPEEKQLIWHRYS